MSKIEVKDIDSPSGESVLTLGGTNSNTVNVGKSTSTTNVKGGTVNLGASGTNIVIPSGATLTNNGTASGFSGTPNFLASLTGSHMPANNVETTAIYNTVAYDSDSGYNNTTGEYTVPSGKGGKYLFSASWNATTGSTQSRHKNIYLFKNNVQVFENLDTSDDHAASPSKAKFISLLLDVNAGDVIKVRYNFWTTAANFGNVTYSDFDLYFSGIKLA